MGDREAVPSDRPRRPLTSGRAPMPPQFPPFPAGRSRKKLKSRRRAGPKPLAPQPGPAAEVQHVWVWNSRHTSDYHRGTAAQAPGYPTAADVDVPWGAATVWKNSCFSSSASVQTPTTRSPRSRPAPPSSFEGGAIHNAYRPAAAFAMPARGPAAPAPRACCARAADAARRGTVPPYQPGPADGAPHGARPPSRADPDPEVRGSRLVPQPPSLRHRTPTPPPLDELRHRTPTPPPLDEPGPSRRSSGSSTGTGTGAGAAAATGTPADGGLVAPPNAEAATAPALLQTPEAVAVTLDSLAASAGGGDVATPNGALCQADQVGTDAASPLREEAATAEAQHDGRERPEKPDAVPMGAPAGAPHAPRSTVVLQWHPPARLQCA